MNSTMIEKDGKPVYPPMRCKYTPDIYTATFFALTNEYKWKYKFTDAEISSFLTESYAILFLQMLLTFMIVFQNDGKKKNAVSAGEIDFYVTGAQLIANIVLHYSAVANVRNGIYMMRQVMFNADAFAHPITGFTLGLMTSVLFIIIEGLNATNLISFSDFDTVLAKFVSYSILLQVPSLYTRQRTGFNIKFDVEDFFLTIQRGEGNRANFASDFDKIGGQKVLKSVVGSSVNRFYTYLYRALDIFYNVVYFYLFQLIIFISPMIRLLDAKALNVFE